MKNTLHCILLALLVAGLFTACVGEGKLVEVPTTLMQYQHHPTQARALSLAKSYAEAINQNLRAQTPFPGQYADYGVVLAQLGCTQQANLMFNNEKFLFPGSTRYIDLLRQTLTPNHLADNRVDTSQINQYTLDTIPITYTAEEQALIDQQNADPEYQRQLKLKAQEERQKQLSNRKKAQKEREKARKAQQKARKKAKK